MAYTDFRGLAVVMQRGPAFRAAATGAMKTGDLVSKEFAQADATAGGGSAHYVCLEDVDSGASGLFAEWAVIRKPTTLSAGGAATAGNHSGTLGDTLWLSTTAGAAVEVIDGDGIYQIVGQVLSTEDVLLKPSHAQGDYFEVCEKETTTKTLDLNDSGKAHVVTGTSDIVITLAATAVHGTFTVVNGSQDGDKLTSVSPNASDGIAGFDFSNSDDGNATNTKATSKAGDYIKIVASGLTGGLMASELRGVWAGA
tara:strand:+ start:1564 stop:2325 length:762 start_codon:yes stop_codon:yes gene_type:complete